MSKTTILTSLTLLSLTVTLSLSLSVYATETSHLPLHTVSEISHQLTVTDL